MHWQREVEAHPTVHQVLLLPLLQELLLPQGMPRVPLLQVPLLHLLQAQLLPPQ
jgi:hypothetical protein